MKHVSATTKRQTTNICFDVNLSKKAIFLLQYRNKVQIKRAPQRHKGHKVSTKKQLNNVPRKGDVLATSGLGKAMEP